MTKAPIRFRVVPREEGMMLGNLVARRLPQLSLEQGRELVKAGAVYLGHVRVRVPTVRVAPGERVTVYTDALAFEELPLELVRFVHRDDTFVVLDKPHGVPVAPTKQSARGTLSEALRRVLTREGFVRPYVGVVHRLDQGASGLVLFTIRDVANRSLHKQFVEHDIRRSYRVLVHGDATSQLQCDQAIVPTATGARPAEPGEPRAQAAHTRFRRLDPLVPHPGTSLLEAELETGRTHQIRIHAHVLGHPVVGDARYGPAEPHGPAEPYRTDADADGSSDPLENRLHLHAYRLRFDHPLEGRPIDVHAPLPAWARSRDDAPDV